MAAAGSTDEREMWDVVVIGAGPAGENAADYARHGSGLSAVLVEERLVGGECSYWACVPSKAMLRPVELLDAARQMPGVKRAVAHHGLDVAEVLERRDRFAHHHDDSTQVAWAERAGLDVVRGRGRLAGEYTVDVTAEDGSTRTIRARHAVVLATGTSASVPSVPGLADARPWTSRDVTNLHEVPRRVVVIGGGVVACEAVTWLRALGSQSVTVVEPAARLLGHMEPFASDIMLEQFRGDGVVVHLGQEVARVERPSVGDAGEGCLHGGEVTVILDSGETILSDEVLVAAGRTPNSEHLGLETVGASANTSGYVDVDEHLTVPGTEWLYAVGDLCGRSLLTHMGKYQARIAGDVIAARAAGTPLEGTRFRDIADGRAVPQVTFTHPEVGSVGLTTEQAQERGIVVETVDYELGTVGGASLFRDGYKGHARVVVDRSSDTIVGATFVGTGIAELVHSATVAVVTGATVEVLWHAVPSFPTISEIWLRLLETLRSQRSAG